MTVDALPMPFFITILDAMTFESTAFWNGFGKGTAREETLLRRRFWTKAKRVAARLPFAPDLLAAYYCAFDRDTPLRVKTALVGAMAYFVMPADALPDLLPALGYADDATVVVTTVHLLADHILPLHREAAREKLAEFNTQN